MTAKSRPRLLEQYLPQLLTEFVGLNAVRQHAGADR